MQDIHLDMHLDRDDAGAETETDSVSLTMVSEILLKSIAWYFLYARMCKLSRTSIVNIRQLPFLEGCLDSVMMTVCDPALEVSDVDNSSHERRLTNVLQAWNFARVATIPDGNCLFSAIAYGIRLQIQQGNRIIKEILEKHNVCSDMTLSLRRLVVEEWLGENCEDYQSFLTHANLQVEALKFLQPGVFSGEMGDLVIKAVANIIQTPIVLFTSAIALPVVVVMPRNAPLNDAPIFVAFNQHGAGHYDAVTWSNTEFDHQKDAPALSEASCSCGRKGKTDSAACIVRFQDSYASKCPCYHAKKACGPKCRCKNCLNPYGQKVRNTGAETNSPKHIRASYEMQSHSLRGTKGEIFMEEVGEPIVTGPSTNIEFLVVVLIMKVLNTDSDYSAVASVYKSVQGLAEQHKLSLPLPDRTPEEIWKTMKSCSFQEKTVNTVHQ